MKKKSGVWVVLAIIFVFMLLYLSINAVSDLTNIEDLHTVKLSEAYKVQEFKQYLSMGRRRRSGSGIPIGTDYYYMGIEKGSTNAYIIKASPEWFEKNFDSDHMAVDSNGVEITALADKIHHEIFPELHDQIAQAEDVMFPLGEKYYLNLDYKTSAVTKLIFVVVCIIMIATGIYGVKNMERIKPLFVMIWIVAFLGTVIFMGKVLKM